MDRGAFSSVGSLRILSLVTRHGPPLAPMWWMVARSAVPDLMWLAYGQWRGVDSSGTGGVTATTAWAPRGVVAPAARRGAPLATRELPGGGCRAAPPLLLDGGGLPRCP